MPFDWREYLRLARYIQEQGDRSLEIDREAAYRCAVSRAYYAAFCCARNHARDHWGFAGEGISVHRALVEFLRKVNVDGMAGIASALITLRDWRNRCDYDDAIPRYLNIQFMAAFAISEAQRIVDTLH